MSKKQSNTLILNDKDKKFLHYYYAEGKNLGDAYNASVRTNVSHPVATQRGFQLKRKLESYQDFRAIIRQFSPIPTLGAHMADIAFEAKDPNLRHKGQKLVAQCLGLLDSEDSRPEGGISINILAGDSAAVQVVGSGPGEIEAETLEAKQRKKDGKPQSFIK
uniref:Terminase n=1 Tax=viral metagenome TaxID=1070528 RepID=A0A6M3KXQ7_9ZZZZ